MDSNKMHINELELLAIKFSLKAFFSGFKNCDIGIKSDNTTAVSYINYMGGMTSKLLNSISIETQKLQMFKLINCQDSFLIQKNGC